MLTNFATALWHSIFNDRFTMIQLSIEQEIIQEMTHLMEKTGIESFATVIADASSDEQTQEATLINLKTINSRYDKNEAIVQVRTLMEKYNIQIDELIEQIKVM